MDQDVTVGQLATITAIIIEGRSALCRFYRRWLDDILMRSMDILMAFPESRWRRHRFRARID
jgi:ABC-type dipeptide/oligopeptide/nickel transport system permease subunit